MTKNNLTIAITAALGLGVPAMASADVFISEYIEGSSNNKAIELYNSGDTAIDLSSYTLSFYFNGNTESGNDISLSGILEPQATYVIANSNAVSDITDKSQLVIGGSWYNGDDAIVLSQDGNVVDSLGQIGTDPGSYWESDGVRTQDRTLRRLDSITSGDTTTDDAYEPHTQWQSFDKDTFDGLGGHLDSNPVEPPPTLAIGECGDSATLISAVQGNTDESPLKGEQVIVEAIVTASFQGDDQLSGFFVQQPESEYDNDPTTSEGVFVYHRADTVNVGDKVRMVAEVDEYYGATQLDTVSDFILCDEGLSVTPATIELPVESLNDLEATEGMLVSLPQELTVTENYGLGRYGEFVVATGRQFNPTQIAEPGEAAQAVAQANRLSRILIDDGRTGQNPEVVPYPAPELSAANSLRVGDSVTGITGVMTYGFSAYRVHPTVAPQFIATNARNEAPVRAEQATARAASFNVLNYFNGDGNGEGFPTERGADSAEELERQQAKLVAALTELDADIIGLIEIENDGFGENSALATLTHALSEASGSEWQYVDMGVDNVGTDAITSAIIYRTEQFSEVGTPAHTTAEPFDYGNRAPVAQSFTHTESDEQFTFVVTHLRSKGSCGSAEGDDVDSGDGQGCWNATRVTAANELLAWLDGYPTGVEDSDILIVGDMNAYTKEDPIAVFTDAEYTDLKTSMMGDEHYSYNYRGESGSLDHAFASASLQEKVAAVATWAINADEPPVFDYNLEYQSETQQANYYAPDAYRSSDHDPVIVDLVFAAEEPEEQPPEQPEDEAPAVEEDSSSSHFGWWLLLLVPALRWMRRR